MRRADGVVNNGRRIGRYWGGVSRDTELNMSEYRRKDT